MVGLSWDLKKVSFKDKKSQSSSSATYWTWREWGRPFPAGSTMPSMNQGLAQGLGVSASALIEFEYFPEIKPVSRQKQVFYSIVQINRCRTTQGEHTELFKRCKTLMLLAAGRSGTFSSGIQASCGWEKKKMEIPRIRAGSWSVIICKHHQRSPTEWEWGRLIQQEVVPDKDILHHSLPSKLRIFLM